MIHIIIRVEEVHLESTVELVNVPRLLQTGVMLGKINILYSKK